MGATPCRFDPCRPHFVGRGPRWQPRSLDCEKTCGLLHRGATQRVPGAEASGRRCIFDTATGAVSGGNTSRWHSKRRRHPPGCRGAPPDRITPGAMAECGTGVRSRSDFMVRQSVNRTIRVRAARPECVPAAHPDWREVVAAMRRFFSLFWNRSEPHSFSTRTAERASPYDAGERNIGRSASMTRAGSGVQSSWETSWWDLSASDRASSFHDRSPLRSRRNGPRMVDRRGPHRPFVRIVGRAAG